MKTSPLLCLLLVLSVFTLRAQPSHPRIYVTENQRSKFLERIEKSENVRKSVETMKSEKASFIYWITNEEKYAVFASDILMKYLEGMYYREAPLTVDNHGNANLMGLQTFEVIHERVIEQIAVGYDFLYPYLVKNGKDLKMIEAVFRRWADQEIKNGVPDNNWNLMQARYITLATSQYLFPNDFTVAFGDAHHSRIKMGALEMLVSQYRKYGEAEKEAQVTQRLQKFIREKEYNRGEKLSLFELFFYVDELKTGDIKTEIGEGLITNLFYSPNVSWLVQRNGLDRQNGMMVSENASLGNHSHTNGIAVELYGKGLVIAPDCAAGVSYWSADHKEYYSRYPAHNTVIVDGKSDYANMKGGLPFELNSNYPESSLPGELHGNVTFSNVSFTEPNTDAQQQRLLSIVRTGKTTGYFVDIFRSHRNDGKDIKNEYLYHSQGHRLNIHDVNGNLLKLNPTVELSSAEGDLVGYNYFKNKQAVVYSKPTLSKFAIQLGKAQDVGVNLWMNGGAGRKLFSVLAPESRAVSGTVPDTLLGKSLPTLVVRQEGEAWNRPFVAIIEPYFEKEAPSVTKVSYFGTGKSFMGVEVISRGGQKDRVFSGDADTESKNPISITILKGRLLISSQKSFRLIMPVSQQKSENMVLKATSEKGVTQYKGRVIQGKQGKTAVFELPALQNQELEIEQGGK